ncbi:hypothetical protein FNV43_RR21705 [Rhamnella rubrinervis]|uniref:Uncharacterized protein n=1 Tax=Rhamnella rubrinervis TaxID=2594499 RepID=A0A8K0GUF9_9ROSA|nr:hypothetical protein FNV43_RR21705 [Rhamnella rubrinervis]
MEHSSSGDAATNVVQVFAAKLELHFDDRQAVVSYLETIRSLSIKFISLELCFSTSFQNVEVAVEEGPSKATADDNLHDGTVANEEEEGCEQGRPSSFTDFTEPPEDGDVEGDGMENATDLEYMVGVNSQMSITEKGCVVRGFAPVTVAGWKDIKKEKGDDLLCEMSSSRQV